MSETPSDAYRPCPDGAVLMIRGEAFPCDAMRQMHESSHTHDGWAHASSDAEAIWTPLPAGGPKSQVWCPECFEAAEPDGSWSAPGDRCADEHVLPWMAARKPANSDSPAVAQ